VRSLIQRATATVFVLTLGILIVFWAIKGTKPTGHEVLPILYGALGASALIWLLAELLGWLGAKRHGGNPIEAWMGGRIKEAKTFSRSRRTMGDDWYLSKMREWDTENINRFREERSENAIRYQEDLRTGEVDLICHPPHEDELSEAERKRHYAAELDRYYAQRLKWLKRAHRRLRRGRWA
jgi:hypothetical protein